MSALSRIRRRIQKLGPYQSFILILLPLLLVEPLKLAALVIAGKGHWLAGTGIIIGAYATSLLCVERLFRVLKPKLLMMRWFAKGWTWFSALREKTIAWGERLMTSRAAEKFARVGTENQSAVVRGEFQAMEMESGNGELR
jgi:hypothetical protein